MPRASTCRPAGACKFFLVAVGCLAVAATAAAAVDPAGDTFASSTGPDIVAYSAVHGDGELKLILQLAEAPILADSGRPEALVGFVDLDVDRRPETGELAFAEFLTGQPSDLGDELYIDLSTYEAGSVDLVGGEGETVIGRVAMSLSGRTVTVTVPHAWLGSSSTVHTAAVVGDDSAPSDLVPNGGFLASTGAPPAGAPRLLDGRFAVEISWRDFAGQTGVATAAVSSEDAAVFWFFNAANWEMLVKMVDGCSFNERFWIFAAATTNVEYTLTVTDTTHGATAVYRNSLGTSAAAITDTDAFGTCP